MVLRVHLPYNLQLTKLRCLILEQVLWLASILPLQAKVCTSPGLRVVGLYPRDLIRDLLASRLSPAQLAEAQKLAQEWKPKTPSP